MGFAEVKEWIDKQIAIRNEMATLEEFNSQIRVIDTRFRFDKDMHIAGIDEVADILGVEIYIEDHSEDFERYYFMYEGYKVFELVEKHVC